MDWLLLLPQLAVQVALLVLVLLAGCAVRGAFGPWRREGTTLEGFLWTYAIGLAVWMALIALAGLCGLLTRPVVLGLALIVTGFGAARLRTVFPEFPPLASALRSARAGRFGAARVCVLLYAAAMTALIVVASAAPDMSHDSMWYHLSIPRAWTYTGTIAGSPTNMPSNYALAMEGLFAAFLLFGSEITCSMFYGQVTLMLMLAMPTLAASSFGRRAGWIAAALVLTVYSAGMISIPVYAGNDNAAALFMLLTLIGVAVPGAFPCAGNGGRAGALLGLMAGSAAATKIITAGDMLPILCLVAAAETLRAWKHPQTAARGLTFWLTAAAVAALAYAPWAIRNLVQGCGNPLFPFGQFLLPFRPEFEAIIRKSAAVNTLFPPTPEGVAAALRSLPFKLGLFLRQNGALTLLILLTSIVSLGVRGRHLRIGLALALQISLAIMMRGDVMPELVRYFMLCAPLALVGLAGILSLVWTSQPQLRRITAVALALLALGGILSHIQRQRIWLSHKTTAWPARPVLTEATRLAYAQNKERGGAILPLFERAAQVIPPDAGVLVPDWPYPFYLNRRYVWSCEVSPPILDVVWNGLDAAGAAAWMRSNGVPFILVINPVQDPRLTAMIQGGVLTEALPPQTEGRLTLRTYRLREEPIS